MLKVEAWVYVGSHGGMQMVPLRVGRQVAQACRLLRTHTIRVIQIPMVSMFLVTAVKVAATHLGVCVILKYQWAPLGACILAFMIKNILTLLILIFVLLNSCDSSKNNQVQQIIIPASIDSLENLQVYPLLDNSSLDTVILERVLTIKSNEEVYFEGYINLFDVDDKNNIFVVIQNPSKIDIKVYDSLGNYKTKIGRLGRGPGEFQSIGSIDVYNDKIYVLDTRLQKVVVYSTIDYSLIHENKLNSTNHLGGMSSVMRAREISVLKDDVILLKYESNIGSNDYRRIFYYKLSKDGSTIENKVLDLENYFLYLPETQLNLPLKPPFLRNSLVALSQKGLIFTSWNEDLLIKAHDQMGNYKYSFYYPYTKSSLSLSELNFSREEQNLIIKHGLPDTWPAIHTIEVSSDDKVWISTITDSDSTYDWWISDLKGELLATFSKPGYRNNRKVYRKPLIKIKNGYFYEHEFDFNQGIDRIIKYKINLKIRV
ncbi:6-bladed beta-propeller [bacterium]|nr:6-bladed beta-propeller [bacterium]